MGYQTQPFRNKGMPTVSLERRTKVGSYNVALLGHQAVKCAITRLLHFKEDPH